MNDLPQASENGGNGPVPCKSSTPADPPATRCAALGKAHDLKTIVRRLGPVGPLAVIAASLPAIGGFALLGSLKWSGPWLQSHGELGFAVYVAGFSVLAGLALLPTYALAVLGGWAFGSWGGTAAALCGILDAFAIGYAIARRASGDRVVELVAEQPKWKAVYDALVGGGTVRTVLIVTLLRVPPNSPFAITNLVMAATRVRLPVYLLGTVVGIAPRTAVAAFIGAGASELDFSKPGAWMTIAGIVVTIVVIVIIGVLANRAIAKMTGPGRADEQEAAGRAARPAD